MTNPQTYTEKLFWRMIMWNRGEIPARFMTLTDKYTVQAHVSGLVGEQHLVKLLWHGNDPRKIPFERLPDDYVIKPNHAAGQVIMVNGQADRAEIIRAASSWLYYWQGREYQYYGITPQLVDRHETTPISVFCRRLAIEQHAAFIGYCRMTSPDIVASTDSLIAEPLALVVQWACALWRWQSPPT